MPSVLFRAAAAAVLALSLAGCPGAECSLNTDCETLFICVSGRCVDPGDLECGANQECPEGLYCCANVCGEGRCCVHDSECYAGYCEDKRCKDGARPRCDVVGCTHGVCRTSEGICVECTQDQDCEEPKICGVDYTCVDDCTGGTGGAAGAAGAAGGGGQGGTLACYEGCSFSQCATTSATPFCDPHENCRECNPTLSDCGNQACAFDPLDARFECMPCNDAESKFCRGGYVCVNGRCEVPNGQQCETSDDCTNQVCYFNVAEDEQQCKGCIQPGDCGLGITCNSPGPTTGYCSDDTPDCTLDPDCSPPATVCNAGRCESGCAQGTCAEGFACDVSTGRCYITGNGHLPLGTQCTNHAECHSGSCWRSLITTTLTAQVCSEACARTDDCPWDNGDPTEQFVCWETRDHGNFCMPMAQLFDTPYPALASPGASCDDTFVSSQCRSGYCHANALGETESLCLAACGRDGDCANNDEVCVSGWPIGTDVNGDGEFQFSEVLGFTQLCHAGYGHIGPGVQCGTGTGGRARSTDHDECLSGWCAQTPDFTRPAECAEPCCTPNDCDPTHPICKPIDVWDGVRDVGDPAPPGFQKICLPREYPYEPDRKDIGDPCNADNECKSEICTSASGVGKVCTHTCCTNDDCAGLDFAKLCRPAYLGGDLDDPNYDGVRQSLGRQVNTGTATGFAEAMTTICMPE